MLAWIQIFMAAATALTQVISAIHGVAPDANHMAVAAGLAASGVAHLRNGKNGNGAK
jgi:hypothetical protein